MLGFGLPSESALTGCFAGGYLPACGDCSDGLMVVRTDVCAPA